MTANATAPEQVAVVHATGYTSFGLSSEALALYQARTNGKSRLFDGVDIPRTDPDLLHVVQTLGLVAASHSPRNPLAIRPLPKGTRYVIREYDTGGESIKTEDEFDWHVA